MVGSPFRNGLSFLRLNALIERQDALKPLVGRMST